MADELSGTSTRPAGRSTVSVVAALQPVVDLLARAERAAQALS